MESRVRQVVETAGGALPDPVTVAFEEMALPIRRQHADFAKRVGISQRQLARIVRRDFGMPPKQILRRARALDMASHLRGVADAAEAEALTLRYFDQAQMTREFPVFRRQPAPLSWPSRTR
jgi:AraC-like DNA-binding protein